MQKKLKQMDITDAITYYGITELFDTIGEKAIRLYLKQNKIRQSKKTRSANPPYAQTHNQAFR